MFNDPNEFNIMLDNFGLNNFQHRLFLRAATLAHNIVNKENAPQLIKEQIVPNKEVQKNYNLRNVDQIKQHLALKNHYGESIFIFIKLINNFLLYELDAKLKLFVLRIFNINLFYRKFLKIFPNRKTQVYLITLNNKEKIYLTFMTP